MSGSSEWMQFYQQNSMDEDHVASSVAYCDATAVTTGGRAASESILSPNNSFSVNDQLTPEGCVSKPIRRRSRASRKTPTTLLNANANNFRALVQQFTGCPSKNLSFGSEKGPVNLNFGLGNEKNQRYAASVAADFGNYRQYNYQPSQQQQQPEQQQQMCQEQQRLVSFDNISRADDFSATAIDVNHNEFAADDANFHELTRDVFSSQGRHGGHLL